MEPRFSDDSERTSLPEPLGGELRRLVRHSGELPQTGPLDELILGTARRHFEAVTKRRARPWRRVGWGVAAGLAVSAGTVGVLITFNRAPDVVLRAEDIDRSGGVDMLDAFALALQIEQGTEFATQWDFNGDGCVDGLDVDHVATIAVSLSSDDDEVMALRAVESDVREATSS